MSSADLSAAAHNALSLVSPDVTTFAAFTGNSATILCSSHKGTFFRPTLHSSVGEKKCPSHPKSPRQSRRPLHPRISMLSGDTTCRYKKGTFFRPPGALLKSMLHNIEMQGRGECPAQPHHKRELFFAHTGSRKYKNSGLRRDHSL